MSLRWENCVAQSGETFQNFLANFLDKSGRSCFAIGGAGFDPRTLLLPQLLAKLKNANVQGLYLREERIHPQKILRARADENQSQIQKLLPNLDIKEIPIFSEGKTVIGGRRAVDAVMLKDLSKVTDILIDISALSTTVFFSIVRALLAVCDRAKQEKRMLNLHLFVAEEPKFDHQIQGMPCDIVTMLHGYRGGGSLDAASDKALLWLPTLAPGKTTVGVLDRIHGFISRPLTPIDVCPIIPFPSHDPRMPDKLVEEYREVLTKWKSDTRNFLYAAESDPLDSYRTICSICVGRDRTFHDLTGSTVVLSPAGNKLLAVGAMLAAIERDLPVALVEAVGYDEDIGNSIQKSCESPQINHFWLAGEAYF